MEAASDKFVIVVVDDTKLVSGLGGSGLAMPVEVVQFYWKYNPVRLQELFKEEGCDAKLRYRSRDIRLRDVLATGAEISKLERVVEHSPFCLRVGTGRSVFGEFSNSGGAFSSGSVRIRGRGGLVVNNRCSTVKQQS